MRKKYPINIFGIILISSFPLFSLYSQKDTLTKEQISAFNKEATGLFYGLEGDLLNIMNPDLPEKYLEISIHDAQSYFERSAHVADLLQENIIRYPVRKYFYQLRNMLVDYYDISKEWVIIQEPSFEAGRTAIDPEDGGFYTVYHANLLFNERFIRTRKGIHFNEEYAFSKEAIFEVRNLGKNGWQLQLKDIKLIDEEKMKKEIQNKIALQRESEGEEDVQIRAKEVNALLKEQKEGPSTKDRKDANVIDWIRTNRPAVGENGIVALVDMDKTKSDSLILGTPDTVAFQEYKSPNIIEYTVPGIGHLHFGRRFGDWTLTGIYGVTGLGLIAYGVYNKIESDKYYDRHLEATKLRLLDADYETSNDYNHKFILSTGAGLAVIIINASHLLIRNSKQWDREEDRLGSVKPFVDFPVDNPIPTIGLTYTKNF